MSFGTSDNALGGQGAAAWAGVGPKGDWVTLVVADEGLHPIGEVGHKHRMRGFSGENSGDNPDRPARSPNTWSPAGPCTAKAAPLWCVGEQLYKVQTVLHPAEQALTYTNDAIQTAA